MQTAISNGISSVINKDEEFRELVKYVETVKQRYNRLYDDSPDLFRTIDTNGIILSCNNSYARSLGYTKKELVGTSIFDNVAQESMEAMFASFNSWKQSGHVTNRLVWLKRKNNSTFPVLISANNLYDENGKLIGSNTILRDVSEIYSKQEKINELETRGRQKVKLAMMISHDLKALLNPIEGYCKLLQDPKILGILNSEQLDAVNEIFENSKKLERLIADIHDVQKLEMNQVKFVTRSIDVNAMINIVYTAFKPYSVERKIKIQRIPLKGEFYVKGDVDRLFQIFMNLIRNASNFVPNNGGYIEIGALIQSEFIIFYVYDNGIGIAAEKQEKLFHEFYQVDVVTKDIHSGSGLGLAICKGLVSKMGGRIWVESKEGEGTTIYFSIPKMVKN